MIATLRSDPPKSTPLIVAAMQKSMPAGIMNLCAPLPFSKRLRKEKATIAKM